MKKISLYQIIKGRAPYRPTIPHRDRSKYFRKEKHKRDLKKEIY